jgi:hypothetical protein
MTHGVDNNDQITLGWTVRSKHASAYLRMGWRAYPSERWIPARMATFELGMMGSIVLYEVEANAKATAEEVDGDVVRVWTTP